GATLVALAPVRVPCPVARTIVAPIVASARATRVAPVTVISREEVVGGGDGERDGHVVPSGWREGLGRRSREAAPDPHAPGKRVHSASRCNEADPDGGDHEKRGRPFE